MAVLRFTLSGGSQHVVDLDSFVPDPANPYMGLAGKYQQAQLALNAIIWRMAEARRERHRLKAELWSTYQSTASKPSKTDFERWLDEQGRYQDACVERDVLEGAHAALFRIHIPRLRDFEVADRHGHHATSGARGPISYDQMTSQ